MYEKSFQNIATMTGTTRSTYYGKQAGLNNQLNSLGLNDNVATSDVQEMWNSLASIGANEDTMFERALDNVITKNIVPYLDTTSQSVNLLDERLGGSFVKDIRGISKANLEIAGNNYATQELLQTIIDEVQPMSDEALQNLAQGSEEMTSLINKLTPEMGKDAATAYATQLFKTQKYSDQMMRSGTTSEKLSIVNALEGDINYYDPAQYNDFIGKGIINAQQQLMTGAPGYNSAMNGLLSNIQGSAMGIDNWGQRVGVVNLMKKRNIWNRFSK